MTTALKIPSKSWLVFQYEEALACFRIFYFYQDVSLAPFDYFYYKSGCVKDRANCMEMSIKDNHLVVFQMLDMKTFEMSVFSCDPALLCYPPELSVVKEEPNYDPIEVSDDESANPIADHIVEHNEDEGVPITFRVDNHYRLRKKWAQDHGLDSKMGLTIEDAFGGVWEVQIGVEYSEGNPRYNVTGMKKFVRDKQMAYGQKFQLLYVESKVCHDRFG
ncbi:putative DNA-binding pseudobarrel domain superfamily [Helianthus annuus]|uniref:DNA-binding pseudobarrel domain superfamily n=1 Tax=Helianthus annuus TaxID=4232 RepID=A0A9K3NHA4_HELAN|nr:putative DNA-binding pseudobarrel domain superfamily [Helianthus annuus]